MNPDFMSGKQSVTSSKCHVIFISVFVKIKRYNEILSSTCSKIDFL